MEQLTTVERENLHGTYVGLRESDVQAPPKAYVEKLKGKIPDELWQSMASVTNDQLALMTKFARALPEDQFIEAVLTNEWPAIKLTPAELELLKGGGWRGALKSVLIGGAFAAITATSAGLTVGAALLASGVELGISTAVCEFA